MRKAAPSAEDIACATPGPPAPGEGEQGLGAHRCRPHHVAGTPLKCWGSNAEMATCLFSFTFHIYFILLGITLVLSLLVRPLPIALLLDVDDNRSTSHRLPEDEGDNACGNLRTGPAVSHGSNQ